MKLELVVMDWSGFISNDFASCLEGINQVLEHYGKPRVTREKFIADYRPDVHSFYVDRGINDDMKTIRALFKRFFQKLPRPSLIPGAVEAVREISSDIPVAILSSHPEDEIIDDISRYDLGNLIKYVVGSSDKSTTVDFDRLMRKAGVEKEGVIYAGDMVCDIVLAHMAGIRSVAVAHPEFGYNLRETIEAHRPPPTHGILNSISELPALVKNGS